MAARAALAATGDPRYRDVMELAYGWFLGENDRGLWVADPVRGAGSDALTPAGVNTNEGAESTLMWLMAAEHIRAMRADLTPWADAPPVAAAGAAAGRELVAAGAR
jgi:hypothetical protein